MGNAVLFSIGQQLRAAGSRVLYFAGYKKMIDRYKVEEIEKAADIVEATDDQLMVTNAVDLPLGLPWHTPRAVIIGDGEGNLHRLIR